MHASTIAVVTTCQPNLLWEFASCSRTVSVVFKSSTPCCAHADKSPLTGMLHPRSDAISL